MSVSQNTDRQEIESKLKEAQVYHSMGLYTESLDVYETILTHCEKLDPQIRKNIEEKMRLIRGKIANKDETDFQAVSAQEISIIRETLSSHENISEILDSAFAFRELGLYVEAVSEYEKLFRLGHPPEEIVSEIAKCLMRIHSPSEVIQRVEEMINQHQVGKKEIAGIKFRLGEEMERRGQKGLALELYRAAKEYVPTDKRIGEKVDAFLASLSIGSKYEYLIKEKFITKDQVERALTKEKETGRSTELILMEDFKIKAEELGKSLSIYYGCPFREYDSQLSVPAYLLKDLKKAFLLSEGWVPLSEGDEEIEILIDDPWNLSKVDQVRTLLKTRNVSFSVAVREDIEKFITHFFQEVESEKTAYGRNAPDDSTLNRDTSLEGKGRRRDKRITPRMPEFVYAEFRLGKSSEGEKGYRLNVINYSKNGLGLVLDEKDSKLLSLLNPGDRIKNITFYATWAMINAPAIVRHKTRMKEGVYKGQYVIGVESREIVESSIPSS